MPQEKNYKKNFLTDVIFKIEYSPILELVEGKPENFQKEIIKEFPILEPLEQLGIKVQKQERALETEKVRKITWIFKDKEDKRNIELDSEYLVILFKQYQNYKEFKKLIERVLKIFYKNYKLSLVKRLGLRYINQIELKEKDMFKWDKYIDPALINNLGFLKKEKERIRRTFNTFIISIDDGIFLSFKYGIFNSAFPNKLNEKEFILDYDCFIEGKIESEKIVSKLDKLNEVNTSFFEKSITAEFRKLLNN